jgi:hypothetical protein
MSDINYGPSMVPFMTDVMKTLVEQPDFQGIGGHGLEIHHGGLHSQTSIGLGDTTVNFRLFQTGE